LTKIFYYVIFKKEEIKMNDLKQIKMHWRNFILILIGILVVGIIIGLVITPT